jgi:hypothetical protein
MTEREVTVYRPEPKPRPMPPVRRIIGGLAYDTTTASVLYHWQYGDNPDEPPNVDAVGGALLVNLWGAYFALVYNYNLDPWDNGHEEIRPLTREQAIAWAELHCPFRVEDIFGKMPEAGQAEPYTVVPPCP